MKIGAIIRNALTVIGLIVVIGLAINGLLGLSLPMASDGSNPMPHTGGIDKTVTPSPSGGATADAVGATATASPTPTATRAPHSPLNRSAIERHIHRIVNKYRADNGKAKFFWDEPLQTMARKHSRDMAQHGYVGHDEPDGDSMNDRYQQQSLDCDAKGENVAKTVAFAKVNSASKVTYADSERDVARQIVDMWLASSGHRQNLLRYKYSRQGIGVHLVDYGDRVTVYVTQNFC